MIELEEGGFAEYKGGQMYLYGIEEPETGFYLTQVDIEAMLKLMEEINA